MGASEQVSDRDRAKARSVTPVWARESGKRRSTLSREAIVTAALRIADAEGLAAVSIRRIATELGARTMSLYSYIDSKADLFDLMTEEIAGEVLIAEGLPADWRQAITAIACRSREVGLRHPWQIDLVNQRSHAMIGPNGLRHLEQSVAALSGLRLEPLDAWRAIAAVDDYVLGFVSREIREREIARHAEAGGLEGEELVQPYLQGLADSGEFVAITPLLRDGLRCTGGDFEQGLNWMLDGIERQYG
ncbi:TetR/AcrR family transcriptional regulator C-terminal domain-containing protein [Actinoallomurus sp. NPDC050550]|uniref:TetR/AcrR family transcriptional regulator n=1 Tax=Actinoallomurus sp. NPDC050550 TaxID=3154937 RepID=UPI0033FEF5AD